MRVTGSTSHEVTISLRGCEALVLSDALSAMERRGDLRAIHHDDAATRLVIDGLIASFELVTEEAFASDYLDRVERARREILDL